MSTTIQRNALVPYTSAQMFSLVDDIESYADFLPWCSATSVMSRDEDQVRAQIAISHGALNKAFVTQNRMQQDKMIEMRLVEGPFKHLEGFWRFESLGGGSACKVHLDLDFEFSNRLVGMALGPIFSQIANSLVDAFCQRAEQIYGKA